MRSVAKACRDALPPYPFTVRIVNVPLGNRSYTLRIGQGLLEEIGRDCSRLNLDRRCAVISDRTVARRYARAVLRYLAKAGLEAVLITVPAGETAKSLKSVEHC